MTLLGRCAPLGLVLAAACSGGGGGASGDGSQFELSSITVQNGSTWEINRPIEFRFNSAVDFSTVSLNTIQIQPIGGGTPAVGEFFMLDPSTVVFQPSCPTEADFSDSGLQPGGVTYEVRVVGQASGVTSTSGEPLDGSQTRTFTTPNSSEPSVLFLDTKVGGPRPIVRAIGSNETQASFLQLGGDSTNRIFFEQDPISGGFVFPSDVPVNLYSDPSSEVEVFVEFDQPVDPVPENIGSQRLRLEFESSPGTWEPLPIDVELVRNCSQTGATVRLAPSAPLPQGVMVRTLVSKDFRDLVGQTNPAATSDFGRFDTEVFTTPAFTNPTDHGDALVEEFDLGAGKLGSLEDQSAPFAVPAAEWGGGRLRAGFDFDGTGGPNGTFDWEVSSGQSFLLDTKSSSIIGGPNFSPSTTQQVVNGIVQVRNLRIAGPNPANPTEAPGVLQAQGPNPLIILATGDVEIYGTLDVSGFDAKNVIGLNTANQAELGSVGRAGGGKGGTGSFLTTTSTPRGGNGAGAFDVPNLGGQGGETGYGAQGKEKRRPGGGGGGRLGADTAVNPTPGDGGTGLVAVPGFDGAPQSNGAVTGMKPAMGGDVGPGPFVDADPANDFFGRRLDPVLGLIIGELDAPTAGTGGGAGGDSIGNTMFPSNPFPSNNESKGAGGAGGGGSLQIFCLGKIVFGSGAQVLARGGQGAAGENEQAGSLDKIGGGSGGGSGGHLILQAAGGLDFTQTTGVFKVVNARGGRGGAGKGGPGGENAGGDGGPGLIQIHVPDETTDVLLPMGESITDKVTPPPIFVIPTFGRLSKARSKFVPLGGVRFDPADLQDDDVSFFFGGTDTTPGMAEGAINTTAQTVLDDPPLLPATALKTAPALPHVLPDQRTIVMDGAPLANTLDDVYLRNPKLLQGFALVFDVAGGGASLKIPVVDASYDEASGELTLHSDPSAALLPTSGMTVALVPRFFLVVTNGQPSFLPSNSRIRILFQGVGADASGAPDEGNPIVDWTADVSQLDGQTGIEFFRFEVEFNLDVNSTGLTKDTLLPELEFLRVPFRF